MHWVFEPGFFSSGPVQVACAVGSIVAVVSGVVGVFTVMRGQSFAGHSLADVATAGGSGAFLAGINPLFGFVAGGVAGAGAMEMMGVRRARGRDLATGIVLGASIGLAALFLYLGTTRSSTTGASQQILFGSIFSVAGSTVPIVAVLSVLCLAIMALIHRPLLLSSVSIDMAAARGVRVRVVGLLYMLALALAVGLSSLAIGAILSTALLIGPAAIALRLTKRIGWAMLTASLTGAGAILLGVLLAYDSYDWSSTHAYWPVSFFIVVIIFLGYLVTELPFVRTAAARRGDDTATVTERGR
ncbi:MAG TPA: metal ABC transporter permease [Acidimicrobiales bacterium]|nr:metal ABC transporter permease [Acidimicrobiales bacterium]